MKKLNAYYNQITGRDLTNKQQEQFQIYYDRLVEKNQVMNLTAITEWEDVVLKHFIDSLALAVYRADLQTAALSLIDVGTGAGFPGIPLKIAFPNLSVTLYDSLNKRVKFLQEMIDLLGLDCKGQGSCVAIHGRAEEGGRSRELREQFDLAVSRAVANMAVLSEYCLPFVREGGYFIPYKTGNIEEELALGQRAVNLLGGEVEKVEKLTLPDSDIGRSFVFVKKIKKTPKAYPRKAGTASKQPLV